MAGYADALRRAPPKELPPSPPTPIPPSPPKPAPAPAPAPAPVLVTYGAWAKRQPQSQPRTQLEHQTQKPQTNMQPTLDSKANQNHPKEFHPKEFHPKEFHPKAKYAHKPPSSNAAVTAVRKKGIGAQKTVAAHPHSSSSSSPSPRKRLKNETQMQQHQQQQLHKVELKQRAPVAVTPIAFDSNSNDAFPSLMGSSMAIAKKMTSHQKNQQQQPPPQSSKPNENPTNQYNKPSPLGLQHQRQMHQKQSQKQPTKKVATIATKTSSSHQNDIRKTISNKPLQSDAFDPERLGHDLSMFVGMNMLGGDTTRNRSGGKSAAPGQPGASSAKHSIRVLKKGRQRIRPRKKKFTSLKKKVLQERLNKWRLAHPEHATVNENRDGNNTIATESTSVTAITTTQCVVCLSGYVQLEELQDDDEYEEILQNLENMATKVGAVRDIFIPRPTLGENSNDDDLIVQQKCSAFVFFDKGIDAQAASACWNGVYIGGQCLETTLLSHQNDDDQGNNDNAHDHDYDDQHQWRRVMLSTLSKSKSDDTALLQTPFLEAASELEDDQKITVSLTNILTEEDFEDEDCLEESLQDIKRLAEEVGSVADVEAKNENGGIVLVTYLGGLVIAHQAIAKFSCMVIGGCNVSASIVHMNRTTPFHEGQEQEQRHTRSSDKDLTKEASLSTFFIILHNVLTADDLEDEDCMEETKCDIADLAGHYGRVVSVQVEQQPEQDSTNLGIIKLEIEGGSDVATLAMEKFTSMTIGGQRVSANILPNAKAACATAGPNEPINNTTVSAAENVNTAKNQLDATNTDDVPTEMFSGDKIIPERFAECKRAPKIPNISAGPRHYANVTGDTEIKRLLVEMLGELMRLQKRAMEDKNAKARRRLVMGLREVARGIRSHKVKLVIMANNLDEYGAIDEKLQAILDLAQQEDVPVFFEFSKRTLGKAVGKSIKVSVIGVQSADGAYQEFKKLVSSAPSCNTT